LRDAGDAQGGARPTLLAQARERAEQALDLHPDDDHAWWLLAHIHVLAGDSEAAAEAGRRALLENPSWRQLPPSTLRSLGVAPELVAALLEVESFRRLWESLAPEREATP